MRTLTLKNGMTIYIDRMPTTSVSIEVSVKVGSVDEDPSNHGISHFIEHMLFNGTKKRRTSREISNEIEKVGGDFNAATSHERTLYYVKVPAKHIRIALDVLSDMLINPLFEENSVKKEKKIILDEINLINDQPRFYQWVMFQKELFSKHPARNAIYGRKDIVKKLSRDNLVEFYRKYYTPSNISVVLAGDISKDDEKLIRRCFEAMSPGKAPAKKKISEPANKKPQTRRMKKKTLQSYMVFGYKTPKRGHKDSYALDVIRAILGKGQSGWVFDSIRTELGLAYEVGVTHNPATDFGFFAIYVGTNKKNQDKVKKEILNQLKRLQNIKPLDIKEAKTFIEGEFLLNNEDTQRRAELLAYWDANADIKGAEDYLKKIKEVSISDIKKAANRWLGKNYTMVVIE